MNFLTKTEYLYKRIITAVTAFALAISMLSNVNLKNAYADEKTDDLAAVSAQIDENVNNISNLDYSKTGLNCFTEEITTGESCFDKVANTIKETVETKASTTLQAKLTNPDALNFGQAEENQAPQSLSAEIKDLQSELENAPQTPQIESTRNELKTLATAQAKMDAKNFNLEPEELTAVKELEGKQAFEAAHDGFLETGADSEGSLIMTISHTLKPFDNHGNPFLSAISVVNEDNSKLNKVIVKYYTEKLDANGDFVKDIEGTCSKDVNLGFAKTKDLDLADFDNCSGNPNSNKLVDGAIFNICFETNDNCAKEDENGLKLAFRESALFALGVQKHSGVEVFDSGTKERISESAQDRAKNAKEAKSLIIAGGVMAAVGVLVAVAMVAVHIKSYFKANTPDDINGRISAANDLGRVRDFIHYAEENFPREQRDSLVGDFMGGEQKRIGQMRPATQEAVAHQIELLKQTERDYQQLDVLQASVMDKAYDFVDRRIASGEPVSDLWRDFHVKYGPLRFQDLKIRSAYARYEQITGTTGNGAFDLFAVKLSREFGVGLESPELDEMYQAGKNQSELFARIRFNQIAYMNYGQQAASVNPEFARLSEETEARRRTLNGNFVFSSLMLPSGGDEAASTRAALLERFRNPLFLSSKLAKAGLVSAVLIGMIGVGAFVSNSSDGGYALKPPTIDPNANGDESLPTKVETTSSSDEVNGKLPVKDMIYSNESYTQGCAVMHLKHSGVTTDKPVCDSEHISDSQYGITGLVKSAFNTDIVKGDEIWMTAKVDGGIRDEFVDGNESQAQHFVYDPDSNKYALLGTQGRKETDKNIYLLAYGSQNSVHFINRVAAFCSANADEVEKAISAPASPATVAAANLKAVVKIEEANAQRTASNSPVEMQSMSADLISANTALLATNAEGNSKLFASIAKREQQEADKLMPDYSIERDRSDSYAKASLQSIIYSADKQGNKTLRNQAILAYESVQANGETQNQLMFSASNYSADDISSSLTARCVPNSENNYVLENGQEAQTVTCQAIRSNTGRTEKYWLSAPDSSSLILGGEIGECAEHNALTRIPVQFNKNETTVNFNACVKPNYGSENAVISVSFSENSLHYSDDFVSVVNISSAINSEILSKHLQPIIDQQKAIANNIVDRLDKYIDSLPAGEVQDSLDNWLVKHPKINTLSNDDISFLMTNGFADALVFSNLNFLQTVNKFEAFAQFDGLTVEKLEEFGMDYNKFLDESFDAEIEGELGI